MEHAIAFEGLSKVAPDADAEGITFIKHEGWGLGS